MLARWCRFLYGVPVARKKYVLSPIEAAAYLGVHQDTLKRWADDEKVRCWVTPGGLRKFAVEDLDALLPQDAS